MIAEKPASASSAKPASRHPLNLPAGSVRALLTIVVVAFIVAQTARGVKLKLLWVETLMIVLAHYFTSRRFVPLSAELRGRLEEEGQVEADAGPLYLPRHTIRVGIVAAFTGLAVYLYRQQRLFEPQAVSILGTVGAYLLGVVAKAVMDWWSKLSDKPTPGWWIDAKALATIGVVVATVAIHLLGAGPKLPFPVQYLENVSLGLLLFYFGSR